MTNEEFITLFSEYIPKEQAEIFWKLTAGVIGDIVASHILFPKGYTKDFFRINVPENANILIEDLVLRDLEPLKTACKSPEKMQLFCYFTVRSFLFNPSDSYAQEVLRCIYEHENASDEKIKAFIADEKFKEKYKNLLN